MRTPTDPKWGLPGVDSSVTLWCVPLDGSEARRLFAADAVIGWLLHPSRPELVVAFAEEGKRSRMELIVPAEATIRVNRGDRVRSGESVVAEVDA